MKSTLAQLAFVVAAGAIVFCFVLSARDGEQRRLCTPSCALRPHYAGNNRSAPDFELPKLDGSVGKLSDYRGKVVILNFWTKTCRPCLEEMPSLSDFGEILQGHSDIELLTISTDESIEDASATLESVLSKPATFTTFVDADNEVVAERFGTKLYPETWFIDKNGVIRARIDGGRDWLDPLHLEFAQTLAGAISCPIAFDKQEPQGEMASLCGDIPLAL